MKTFHCSQCQSLVFFENVQCLNCGHSLAYLPDCDAMAAIPEQPTGDWIAERFGNRRYRLCQNYPTHNVCNWAVPAEDPDPFCRSCRLTRVIPDLSAPGAKEAWARLETAKRRLIRSLFALNLPVEKKDEGPGPGLAFEFLADSTLENGDRSRVLTGHDNGLITVNIAEADDVQRERQRAAQHEPYRTVLGHLRHEVGHYYWDRLLQNSERLTAFRELLGDERADYGAALEQHYKQGPPAQWEENFISAYATTHPWEDWAETWAHYLHMIDALETAAAAGLTLRPEGIDEPAIAPAPRFSHILEWSFDQMIARWMPLAHLMNNLSRSLGHHDSYPFVLSPTVLSKLRFIDETIRNSSTAT